MRTIIFLLLLISTGCFSGCEKSATGAKPELVTTSPIDTPPVNANLPTVPTLTPTPKTKETVKKDGLVELVKLDDTIKLDVRYATKNNFVGREIYKEARAFLQSPAAEAAVRIHQNLKKQNLGLVIFDGYRPLAATKLFWEVTPASKKKFVANPKNGSRHNRGCAVDLGLFDLETKENLEMPSGYDDFTERAAIDYASGTEQQRKNRAILRQAMEADGFKVYSAEWWHYDFQACPESRILDVQFSEIK
ncbi:MAG: M15 family metallopeptidase [Pyrinomonadaceae bacterium]|nr:M15 family metallopeptidase [Pyrinomonadaceae bacterium]